MSELTVELVINESRGENYHSIMGGDDSNPTWDEYLNDFQDEFKPHMNLVKECIIKNKIVGITGEQKQNAGYSFLFSDGNHIGFSWRAWGDLMQAIVNKKEGYMKYYM